ncbi:MAG: DEAD/DEAH box helicase [Lachnospiraceae bacterium]|nr:DEAD/DEAH box helicase [Lachnospiraceae bacterium]
MEKINFTDVKKLMNILYGMDSALEQICLDRKKQEDRIRLSCRQLLMLDAQKSLKDISVDELKKSKAGIRVSALAEAGYTDMGRLSTAEDWELREIPGIGDKQIEAIRNIIFEFVDKISSYSSVTLTPDDDKAPQQAELKRAVYEYRRKEVIRHDVESIYPEFHDYVQALKSEHIIKNRVQWLFSGRELKDHTAFVVAGMASFCNGPLFERAGRFIGLYGEASAYDDNAVWKDYEKNSADYYAILESLGVAKTERKYIYSSIPERLADEIDSLTLNTDGFHGTLRSYQTFGAKYILNQEKVLLGDEMGLGKTIQAIAAMAHISSQVQTCHFLIVCPASVLINWCREIKKFCSIPAYLVHGSLSESALERWIRDGGAAVTNYEMMKKIIDRIDEKMSLDMLIVDEAHYIKNPDAKRTGYIRRLENESKRILMMTGTPLENRVDEMCSLIDFIRPDKSDEIRGLAQMSNVPEFRQVLAPFYLRRTREQVLKELPQIEEKQEWCMMTPEDTDLYRNDVMQSDFAGMRKVSFRQPDLSTSAKGQRLMELCDQALMDERKVVVYSFFKETVEKVSTMLGKRCAGVISGDTPVAERQAIIDRFSDSEKEDVLVCQVQSGGTGLNIQAASIVIFCEPQIKPSLTNLAISRVYRMGQVRNVLVLHLLCENTVDEAMLMRLSEKQLEFDTFADRSAMGEALDNLLDREWIHDFVEKEREKYLPMVIPQG